MSETIIAVLSKPLIVHFLSFLIMQYLLKFPNRVYILVDQISALVCQLHNNCMLVAIITDDNDLKKELVLKEYNFQLKFQKIEYQQNDN